MTKRGWGLFAAMCFIWGIPYLLIRVAVRDVTPGTLVFIRTGAGGLILLPIALRSGGWSEEGLAQAGAAFVYASVKELFDEFDASPLSG